MGAAVIEEVWEISDEADDVHPHQPDRLELELLAGRRSVAWDGRTQFGVWSLFLRQGVGDGEGTWFTQGGMLENSCVEGCLQRCQCGLGQAGVVPVVLRVCEEEAVYSCGIQSWDFEQDGSAAAVERHRHKLHLGESVCVFLASCKHEAALLGVWLKHAELAVG